MRRGGAIRLLNNKESSMDLKQLAVGAIAALVIGIGGWTLNTVANADTRSKLNEQAIHIMHEDIKEIKADVKKMLEKK
jgi:hypothetical protein